MSVPYRFFYRLGFKPWEGAEKQPEFVAKISALFDREENGREPPYGTALDLGCGSGIWGIALAKRGWQVTGVDYSAKALGRARNRVREEGVEMNLLEGDVTDLCGARAGSGYRMVLDTGTFHGLDPEQRQSMGREVSEITARDGSVLLLAWNPRRRGPFPRGVDRGDVESAFPGWLLTEEGESGYPPPQPLRAKETWYRLTRA